MSHSDYHTGLKRREKMTISGNARRIQRCREKKSRLGMERVEICLGGDLLDRLKEDARYQGIPFPRLIESVLIAHLQSGKRIWA
jgi:predicted DNA binding CopG/RHH family protein